MAGFRVQSAGQLFPVAGYYDEGIVYPHGQPDHDDHEGDEEEQIEGLTDERRNAHGNNDAQ